MKVYLYISIFVLFLSLPNVYAYNIVLNEIRINENATAFIFYKFSINSTNVNEVRANLFEPIAGVKAYDKLGALDFNISDNEVVLKPRENTDSYSFTVKYETDSIINKYFRIWNVSFYFSSNIMFDTLITQFVIPEKYVIKGIESPDNVFYDKGKIVIEFYSSDTNFDQHIISYSYKHINEKNQEMSRSSNLSITPFLIVIPILVTFLFLVKKHKDQGYSIPSFLNEREKDILKALLKRNGNASQKQIMLDTGLPKSSLSRIIKKLERLELIEVKRYGLVNRIVLKKKGSSSST